MLFTYTTVPAYRSVFPLLTPSDADPLAPAYCDWSSLLAPVDSVSDDSFEVCIDHGEMSRTFTRHEDIGAACLSLSGMEDSFTSFDCDHPTCFAQ